MTMQRGNFTLLTAWCSAFTELGVLTLNDKCARKYKTAVFLK